MATFGRLKGMEIIDKYAEEEEIVQEGTNGKASILRGVCFALVGLILFGEGLWLLIFRLSVYGVIEVCAGLVFFYAAYRLLYLDARQLIVVTNYRVLWKKTGWVAEDGKIIEIPLKEIESARLFKSTVMFGKSHAGAIRIKKKNGRTEVLPMLQNGEYILETISDMLSTEAERRQDWIRNAVKR